MIINFIRHGKTEGNLEKRYIGRTDEPLCTAGISEILIKQYPHCDILITSPMKRCIETADLIYPDKKMVIFNDFCECDFGAFEGRNYIELEKNDDYNRWIQSGGKMQFPGGESPEMFKKRCVAAFKKAVSEYVNIGTISFVVHGGTIMSILEAFAYPKKDYYDYQISCGCGFVTEMKNNKIIILEQI